MVKCCARTAARHGPIGDAYSTSNSNSGAGMQSNREMVGQQCTECTGKKRGTASEAIDDRRLTTRATPSSVEPRVFRIGGERFAVRHFPGQPRVDGPGLLLTFWRGRERSVVSTLDFAYRLEPTSGVRAASGCSLRECARPATQDSAQRGRKRKGK